jgi:hypothetical protein
MNVFKVLLAAQLAIAALAIAIPVAMSGAKSAT